VSLGRADDDGAAHAVADVRVAPESRPRRAA